MNLRESFVPFFIALGWISRMLLIRIIIFNRNINLYIV